MSYASVTAANALPPSQQPHADPALLNTSGSASLPPVDAYNTKVNVAGQGFKEHPTTVTSEFTPPTLTDDLDSYRSRGPGTGTSGRSRKEKAKEELGKAEAEGHHLYELAKQQILRPGVAGGLLGVLNLGLLTSASYHLYTRPELRSDARVLGGTVAGALVILGAEGLLAEAYANTDAGRDEAERAKREGAAVWRHTKQVVLRPGVLGGLVGVLNLGIIGGLGYTFYTRPELQSDRRAITSVVVGALALAAGEGFIAEQYQK